MSLRQVSGSGHRTQEPYGSAFNALPLSYKIMLILAFQSKTVHTSRAASTSQVFVCNVTLNCANAIKVWPQLANHRANFFSCFQSRRYYLEVHGESVAPLKYKTNLIRNLLHRAYRICRNSRLFKNKIQAITNLLKKNGYPGWIIRNTIQKFLNRQRDMDKNLNKSGQSRKRSNKQITYMCFLNCNIYTEYLHKLKRKIDIF